MRLTGLEPIAEPRSRILILGSFPGEESLRRQEYYGHAANTFWRILAGALEPGTVFQTYRDKQNFLFRYRIALWDVLAACRRKTSLDSRIRNPEPNDIRGLLLRCARIERVLLNGRVAEKYWKRFFSDFGLSALYLPSTSPAHAGMAFEIKLALWRKAL